MVPILPNKKAERLGTPIISLKGMVCWPLSRLVKEWLAPSLRCQLTSKAAGWSLHALLVAAAGIGLTFSMWWIYFALPFGAFLHLHRDRAFFWGNGHMVLFAAIAATGAGLHVAGYFIEHKSHMSSVATVLSVAVPVAVYIASVFVIYDKLAGKLEPSHKWQLSAALIFVLIAIGLSMMGVPLVYCLLVIVLSPVAIVAGYEWFGHHHIASHLEESARHH